MRESRKERGRQDDVDRDDGDDIDDGEWGMENGNWGNGERGMGKRNKNGDVNYVAFNHLFYYLSSWYVPSPIRTCKCHGDVYVGFKKSTERCKMKNEKIRKF